MMCPRVTRRVFESNYRGRGLRKLWSGTRRWLAAHHLRDFSAQSGVRTIETDDGNQVSLPDVPTTQDTLAEDPEKFTMRLTPVSLPDNVQLATTEATATISASDPLTANRETAVADGARGVGREVRGGADRWHRQHQRGDQLRSCRPGLRRRVPTTRSPARS